MNSRLLNIFVLLGLLFLFTQPFSISAQTNYLDSLKNKLSSTKQDSVKVQILKKLSLEFVSRDLAQASDYANTGIMLAKKLNNKNAESYLLDNLGYVYLYYGNFDKAIATHIVALKIHDELNDAVGSTRSLNGIGFVYDMQKNNPKALEYYYKSLNILKGDKYKSEEASTLLYLGGVFARINKTDSALFCYNKALLFFQKDSNSLRLADVFQAISNIQVDKKDFDLAEKNLLRAKSIVEHNSDRVRLIDVNLSFARLYFSTNNYKKCIQQTNDVLLIAKEIGVNAIIKDCYELLAKSYAATKDYKKAYLNFSQYVQLKDSSSTDASVAQLEAQFQKEKNEIIHQKELELISIKEKNTKIYATAIILFLFIAFAIGYIRYKQKQALSRALELKNEKLNLAYKMIEEKNKEIHDSMQYASRIQHALLTSKNYIKKYVSDFFIYYAPKDIVSGDFYWALQHNDCFYLATADCTGHGVPGAFMSMLNITLLNEVVIERNILSPDEILNHVRNEIIKALNQEETDIESKDGMDCILCKFDFKKMELQYAAANNSFYVIRNNELIVLKADKMPVGKFENDAVPFTLQTFTLQKGDTVYTLTDGYADQFGGSKGKKFKYKQLEEILLANVHLSTYEQNKHLEKSFNDWKGNLEQVDDVCIIGINV